VSLPENARKRNPLQYFFVNGRNMRHHYFHKAVMTCYEDLISADVQPNYFLNFEVDPQTIDVNIHPTKNEIKFENEQPIWQILVAAIKECLGKFNVGPAIDFDAQDAPDIPVFNPDASAEHGIVTDTYNPFATGTKGKASALNGPSAVHAESWRSSAGRATSDWGKLYEGLSHQPDALPAADSYNPFAPDAEEIPAADDGGVSASALNDFLPDEEALTSGSAPMQELPDMEQRTSSGGSIMQIRNKYIVTPSREGLLIVDRYRAHVRVLFERFASTGAGSLGDTQRVIFPEVLSLSASQNAIFLSLQDEVAALGFDLSFIGDNSWSINGIPSALSQGNPADALLGIIENVTETGRETGEELHRAVALAMARSAAVRPGQPLTPAECERLLSDLFTLPDPRYTPDGHPVMFTLSAEEISRRL
ncbi:MAG: DNA mismatch repair protein MutL, partial [Muribaculaceae bacterium]|nr:DNA mismatch repair protein MutL [Muribaculaceae bacterium]